MNTRTMTLARASRVSLVVAATAALALSMAYLVRPVLATQPDPLHKVTICHRTDSEKNPYVQITVDEASVDGNAGNDKGKGDHLLEHQGLVWAGPNTPKEPKWGDIIPPFYSDGVTLDGYPSLNWNAAGQAIFDNGCKPAEEQSQGESESQGEPQSQGESAAESAAGEQSGAESASGEQSGAESASGEQSVEAGVGTPAASTPDGALPFSGSSPLPTIAFSLILLASLGTLAYANVKSVRSIR